MGSGDTGLKNSGVSKWHCCQKKMHVIDNRGVMQASLVFKSFEWYMVWFMSVMVRYAAGDHSVAVVIKTFCQF